MAEPAGVPTNAISDPPPLEPPGADRDRRRLLGGATGAATLLTLLSGPVFGSQRCAAPSSFASMPASQYGALQVCVGRPPAYWKDSRRLDQWPSPYRAKTRFDELFEPSPYPRATSLLEALEKEDGPPDDVARHMVATVLNVAKGWVPILTVISVQGIWRRYMATGGGATGYFEPTRGTKWFHDDIVVYLRSTMPI
jgi:hypothetical protein